MAKFNLKNLYPDPDYILSDEGQEIRRQVIDMFKDILKRTIMWKSANLLVDAKLIGFTPHRSSLIFGAITLSNTTPINEYGVRVGDLSEYIKPYSK